MLNMFPPACGAIYPVRFFWCESQFLDILAIEMSVLSRAYFKRSSDAQSTKDFQTAGKSDLFLKSDPKDGVSVPSFVSDLIRFS